MTAKIVNLFGGPGVSKSTTAALVFGKLKANGVNAELVTEFAKELVWEERDYAVRCTPFLFGEQLFRLERLRNKVSVVVTDSPILLCTIYGRHYGNAFCQFACEQHERFDNVNVRLVRNEVVHPYNPKGRLQTEDEAKAIDTQISRMLLDHPHTTIPVGDADATANRIVELL